MKKLSFHGVRQSLIFRVLLIIFIIVFAAMLLLSFYAGSILYNNTFENTQNYSFQLFEQASKNITTYITTMENIYAISSTQSNVISFLFGDVLMGMEDSAMDESNYFTYMRDIKYFLVNLTVAQDNIECVTIIADRNGQYVDSRNALGSNYPYKEQDWYAEAFDHPDQIIYLPPHIPDNLPGASFPVISYVRAMSMYKGGESLGVMLIDLDNGSLESILNDISLGESGYAFIINSKGEYIYYPDESFLTTGEMGKEYADSTYILDVLRGNTSFIAPDSSGQENVVFSTPVENTDWHLVGVIPYDQINQPAISLRATQILIGLALAGLVCVLIALFFRASVFGPLSYLRNRMAEVESGNLNVAFDTRRSDEIGQLGEGFNTMIIRLKTLISDIRNSQQQKRKAEFAALQAQINPHFLYNTLDSIVWMAETNPAGASEMAYLLGSFFRQSLSGGQDIIPISQELSISEAYLNIQRIRYESYFDYEIYYTQDVADFEVPKLIVQPLVENAIYHGIKQSGRKCYLTILAFRHEDYIYIQVIEDGVGMSEHTIQKVMDGQAGQGMSGVGALNVDDRIKLHFTDNSGLYYQSHEGMGTVACIYIKVQ